MATYRLPQKLVCRGCDKSLKLSQDERITGKFYCPNCRAEISNHPELVSQPIPQSQPPPPSPTHVEKSIIAPMPKEVTAPALLASVTPIETESPQQPLDKKVEEIAPKDENKDAKQGCLGLFIFLFIFFVMWAWISEATGCGKFDRTSDTYVTASAEVEIQSRLRDPKSFQVIDSIVYKLEDGGKRVVINYRAKNGFGGYNTSSATIEFDAQGNMR
jgi:hypothetical protein